MSIHFHFTEMVTTLQKLGYEVKKEKEIYYENYNDNKVDREHWVWLVYKYGVDVREPWMDRLSGTEVVQYIFESEIRRKILSLF